MSVRCFDDLLKPITVAEFRSEIIGITLFHGRTADSDRFASLIDWSSLEALLRDHQFAWPRLRLTREAQEVPLQSYSTEWRPSLGESYSVVNANELQRELMSGSSLVLDRIDEVHEPVRRLTESIEANLRERVQANLYASWNESMTGFGTHWDDHDVLVVQVSGVKRWLFADNPRPFPLRDDYHPDYRAPDSFDKEIVLEPGDWLYVPRGPWHHVAPHMTPSLSISFGIRRPTGIDLLNWMTDQMVDREIFRRDVPRYRDDEECADYLRRLAHDYVVALTSVDTLDRFLLDRDARAPIRPRFSFGSSAGGLCLTKGRGTVLRWCAPRAVVEVPEEETTSVSVSANGRTWVFDRICAQVIRVLSASTLLTYGELTGKIDDLGEDDLHSVLTALAREGLVEVTGG